MSGMFSEVRKTSKHKSVEWYTPAWIFEALGLTFDLDPASPHDMDSAVPALKKYTVFDDGLKLPWHGRVWLNPPFNRQTGDWMRRMINHQNGIALLFSRTDAGWFQEAMRSAQATLLLSGRLDFVPGKENQHKKARAGAGTVMFAFDPVSAIALEKLKDNGILIKTASPFPTCATNRDLPAENICFREALADIAHSRIKGEGAIDVVKCQSIANAALDKYRFEISQQSMELKE